MDWKEERDAMECALIKLHGGVGALRRELPYAGAGAAVPQEQQQQQQLLENEYDGAAYPEPASAEMVSDEPLDMIWSTDMLDDWWNGPDDVAKGAKCSDLDSFLSEPLKQDTCERACDEISTIQSSYSVSGDERATANASDSQLKVVNALVPSHKLASAMYASKTSLPKLCSTRDAVINRFYSPRPRSDTLSHVSSSQGVVKRRVKRVRNTGSIRPQPLKCL